MRVIATAGHVDHGKSTLVKALTGMEPDRLSEEQRRGLTIDLGFVWTTLEHQGQELTVAFVDVPGHHRFVANMLAGASAVHDALFVVAADDGWSAQSTEHLAILDLLDVRGVAIAVTKADTVAADRLDQVVQQVRSRLSGTSMADTPVMAVDSLTGRGIPELASTLAARLAATTPQPTSGDARLWIDRSFTIAGAGTIVTGTLQGGSLRVGQEVQHAPSGENLRIRGLQSLGEQVDQAPEGSRVAVNLARISHADVHRGEALLTGRWITTRTIYVDLQSISDRPVVERGSWTLHAGTEETAVTLRPLLGAIEPGERGPVWAKLDKPLPLRSGDHIVLRSSGRQTTEAGGRILDPDAPPRPRGSLARLEAAEHLEELARSAETHDKMYWLLQLHGGTLTEQQLSASIGATSDIRVEGATWLSGLLVDNDEIARWEAAALLAVDGARAERGAFLSDVTKALGRAGCPKSHQKKLVERMTETGMAQPHGDILTRPEHSGTYLAARAERRRKLVDDFSTDPLNPPDLQDAADRAGMVGAEIQSLFDEGILIRVGDVVLTAHAVAMAHERLAETYADQGFTASDARKTWGTTRKFTIPLLEHLSATGRTTFDGDYHYLNEQRNDG